MCGDSPTLLLLREAESDNSVLDWKEEMEEFVSSVIEVRNGVLSDEVEAGDGPLLWAKLYVSDVPLMMMGVLAAETELLAKLTRLFPGSSDLWIPCKFFRCLVLSPLYLNLFPQT